MQSDAIRPVKASFLCIEIVEGAAVILVDIAALYKDTLGGRRQLILKVPDNLRGTGTPGSSACLRRSYPPSLPRSIQSYNDIRFYPARELEEWMLREGQPGNGTKGVL